MSDAIQTELFEQPLFKVRWKAFEELFEWDNRKFANVFSGFSDKTKIKTTIGSMTITEATSFADFVSTGLYEYAGWHEIIKA